MLSNLPFLSNWLICSLSSSAVGLNPIYCNNLSSSPAEMTPSLFLSKFSNFSLHSEINVKDKTMFYINSFCKTQASVRKINMQSKWFSLKIIMLRITGCFMYDIFLRTSKLRCFILIASKKLLQYKLHKQTA